LLCAVFKHPSGHELPIKQNGATPYHLHNASTDWGTIVKNRRITIVVFNIDETIITIQNEYNCRSMSVENNKGV
jgi:hypothetical protein